ncbi:unnamed protein product [Tenebrio molitor]|nr:unnamed protein product [Tenebrio molitor]
MNRICYELCMLYIYVLGEYNIIFITLRLPLLFEDCIVNQTTNIQQYVQSKKKTSNDQHNAFFLHYT